MLRFKNRMGTTSRCSAFLQKQAEETLEITGFLSVFDCWREKKGREWDRVLHPAEGAGLQTGLKTEA